MRLDSWNVALLLAAPFAAACSEPAACALNIEPGVEVEVRDRITGDFLSTTPRGLVREGTFEDSLKISATTLELPPRVVSLIAAEERTGPARFTAALDPAS
jgi:hypothetical protein